LCDNLACGIRYGYYPVLAVPTHIRNLNPEWSDCALPLDGAYDPPHALGTAAVLTPAVEVAKSTAEAAPSPKDSPANLAHRLQRRS
jgi:hypothetical protein